jgi:hypothetical protein
MAFTRDPVSVLLDGGARRLLARAYAARGQWAGTVLAPPTMAHRAWALAQGINLDGAAWTGNNRWDQAFERALNYQHKWFHDGNGGFRAEKRMEPQGYGLEVEFGRTRRIPGAPRVLFGRAVRCRVHPKGKARERMARVPDSRKAYDNDGKPAGRFAHPDDRDW